MSTFPERKDVRNFLIEKFGCKTLKDLEHVNFDGKYVISSKGYFFDVEVKERSIHTVSLTPESKKLYEERKAHGERMEKIAEELCPGEENYCWHEDKKVVYYGGDWEDDEDQFFTEEQLTTKLKETKKMLKEKEKEQMKNVPRFSINDIIDMYEYSKKLGYKDFSNFLRDKGTNKGIFFKKNFK